MRQEFEIVILNEKGTQVKSARIATDNAQSAYAYVISTIQLLNDGEPRSQVRLTQHTAVALTNNHIIIVYHIHHDSK